jgi:acyl-CoA hydrolase
MNPSSPIPPGPSRVAGSPHDADVEGTPSVHPEVTRTEMAQIVLPSFANARGTAFGGQIAAWSDVCAAISAQRYARSAVVTASMDELHFLRPIRAGMIVVLKAQVNAAWRSSMEVGVRVEAEEPTTGHREHCCSAYLTFVSLDEAGRPRLVPELDTGGDPVLERRNREAGARREARLRMRELRRAAL